MKQDSQFRFIKSEHVQGLTLLQATMSDFSYDRHAHGEYCFGVTLTGRQDFFGLGAYHRSPPGNVIQFNPGDVHDGHSGGDEPLHYVMLYIDPEQLEPLFADAAGLSSAQGFRVSETLLPDPVMRQHILDLVRLIMLNVGSNIEQEYALYRIAVRAQQREGKFDPNGLVREADRLLWRGRDFIHDHVSSDISLEDISQAASLSKYHFLRLFRRQFGITPHQYVLSCRVNAARRELDAGVPLNDVVYRYGFADLSHFNRRFKRIYAMTPKQYQESVAR
ncbi:helix-turn-helix transcriptional regulator [Mangrovitalea sediminis]|uniref:helix-turn-helix transcriptional regulator n=1 Tax=Mangrovitalea sediminis TaxID=1982043 RepID=UPI000BE54DC5|nr:AraC family transcriptional regulator [Mangrovitalea sediminis]